MPNDSYAPLPLILLPLALCVPSVLAAPQPDLLRNARFTDGDDTLISPASWLGWRLNSGEEINTGGGNDKIVAKTNPYVPNPFSQDRENAFKNRGVIKNPSGSLTIEAYSYPSRVRVRPPKAAYAFVNETLVLLGQSPKTRSGVIISGDGNDRLYGYAESYAGVMGHGMYLGSQPDTSGHTDPTGKPQIAAVSITDLGGGDDQIIGEIVVSNSRGYGITINEKYSRVLLGNGNDLVSGTATASGNKGWASGLRVSRGALLHLGAGNDQLRAVGNGPGGKGIGILLTMGATIRAGDGNDVVNAAGAGLGFMAAIKSDRGCTLDLGPGNDQLVALKGGLKGGGAFLMGDGNDVVIGFGKVTVNGGSGEDMLRLPPGNYRVSKGSVISGRRKMALKGFERVGGLEGSGFKLGNGSLRVKADGSATASGLHN